MKYIILFIGYFFTFSAWGDVTIDVSQFNSQSLTNVKIGISGSLDTSFCTSPLTGNLPVNVAGIGAGDADNLQPSPVLNTGIFRGIYNSTASQCVGINSNNPTLLTSAAAMVVADASYGRNDPGGSFGIDNKYIYLDSAYTSGSPIGIEFIFENKTISQLGFTVGTTTWTVGNNNITLIVSNPPPPPPPPVPPPTPINPIPTLSEWAQILMMLMMIGTVGWYSRKMTR